MTRNRGIPPDLGENRKGKTTGGGKRKDVGVGRFKRQRDSRLRWELDKKKRNDCGKARKFPGGGFLLENRNQGE